MMTETLFRIVRFHRQLLKSSLFDMAFHPTYTPVPRRDDERHEKHRSKSPPPRAPKPVSSLASSASRPVPVQARATKPRGTDGERPLAYSLEKDASGEKEEGLGGEPFATYADDVRELVAALQRALKEEEEEAEGGEAGSEGGEKEEEKESKKSSRRRLSEAVSVTRAFLHQQLRLAGDAERRSLAELRSAVKNLFLFEDVREERRRKREAGAEEEEGEGEGGESEKLSEELKKGVRRGLESTLAVLLVEEEAAREKGLLH